MKFVAFTVLSLASLFATAQASSQTEQSNSHKLDVAKVISINTAQDPEKVNGPVDARMVYLDSAGVTRTLDYTILGSGNQNG